MSRIWLLSAGSRLVRHVALVGLLVILGTLIMGDGHGHMAQAASTSSTQAQTLANPVGTWSLQVHFLDCSRQGLTETSQAAMNPSGAWVNYLPYPGGGHWGAIDSATFFYGFTETLTVGGQYVAFVQVLQQAQMTSPTTYTASGAGMTYDAEGYYVETCDTQTTATLISPNP